MAHIRQHHFRKAKLLDDLQILLVATPNGEMAQRQIELAIDDTIRELDDLRNSYTH